MNQPNELRQLAKELDDEHCADYPVRWIADRIREIADRSTT